MRELRNKIALLINIELLLCYPQTQTRDDLYIKVNHHIPIQTHQNNQILLTHWEPHVTSPKKLKPT